MKIGVRLLVSELTPAPDEVAAEVEARGIESLFFMDHSHLPLASPRYPSGGEIPERYRHTYDPLVALGMAAASTSSLVLGTWMLLIAQRDPILLARELATIDVLSGGRLVVGVGFGWNEAELRNHGVDPEQRFEVAADKLAVLRALWADEVAAHEGPHARLSPSWQFPKPSQKPHPPILIGTVTTADDELRRAIDLGDGWCPGDNEDVIAGAARLRMLRGDADRPFPMMVCTTADPSLELVQRYEAAGMDRLVFSAPVGPAEVLLANLDAVAALVDRSG